MARPPSTSSRSPTSSSRGELDRDPAPDAADLPRPVATRCSTRIARHLPELRPVGASAGLHVLAWLPPGDDEAAIVAAADAAGIGMSGMRPRWVAGDGRRGSCSATG